MLDLTNLPEALRGCEAFLGSPRGLRYRELLDPAHADYNPDYVDIVRHKAGLGPIPRRKLMAAPGQFAPGDHVPAPARTHIVPEAWKGILERKPWEYRVTAVIAHLDTPALLRVVVETLRAQTERPYILVIDTGSLAVHRAELEQLEQSSDDLEVHYLRSRGWPWICEAVCAAMDVGFALCRTEYLYSTHTDVFLKTRDHLARLASLCTERTPAVGYRAFPRDFAGEAAAETARLMLGHCSTLYHMPTCRRIGLTWSYERARQRLGLSQEQCRNGWPDTEVGPGLCLIDAGFKARAVKSDAADAGPATLFIGEESEHSHEDDQIDHPRSATGRKLYDPTGAATYEPKIAAAVEKAMRRVEAWKGNLEPSPIDGMGEEQLAAVKAKVDACPHRKPAECGCGGLSTCSLGRGWQGGTVNLRHCLDCQAKGGPDKAVDVSYPSLWEQAKNAATAAVNFAASGFATASDDVTAARLAVCRGCDRFDPEQGRCRECGCFVKVKAAIAGEDCPLGRWTTPTRPAATPTHLEIP